MKIPNIENAFVNIKKACDKKLTELYPMGIPADISARYEQELIFLKNSEHINDFEIFRKLSEEALKCSTIISMRGTVMGSFIYYLLGNNCFNPLPVHYYCPKCGHYEVVSTRLFGIDLPEKKCPNCRNSILADGFNLPFESVWGSDGKKLPAFEYNVSPEFLPFAGRVLSSLYPQNSIAPWGMFQMDPFTATSYPDNRAIGVSLSGYAILPTGTTIQDYPDLISYLENGEPCLTGGSWELKDNNIRPIRLFSSDHIESLLKLQRATGIYANEITLKELRNITWSNIANSAVLIENTSNLFRHIKPKTYRDMICAESASHSTFSWQNTDQTDLYEYDKMISSDSFKNYPCFAREDFFDFLLETGIERALAFDVSEQIRKGHANSPKFRDKFNTLLIPEGIKDVAQCYSYVFPRAHCVEYVLLYARIAYYAQVDSKAFSKIMYRRKD